MYAGVNGMGHVADILQQAEEIYNILLELHFEREKDWMFIAIAALPIGFTVYMILIYRYRAHLKSLFDMFWFFVSPRPPDMFIVLLDVHGLNIDYRAEIYPGSESFVLRAKGKEYIVLDDPMKYATPASVWDMRGPPGSGPSPFSVGIRATIGWLFALLIAAAAWSQTAYITLFAFEASPTWIDVLTSMIFAITAIWAIRNLLELDRSTGLMLTLVQQPPGNIVVPYPTPRSLVEWSRLLTTSTLKTLNEFSETCEKAIEVLKRDIGKDVDEWSAAAIIARATDSVNFREKLAYLEEEVDKQVEASEAQLLRAPEGTGRLARYTHIIAIIAIVFALAAVWLSLGIDVTEPVNETIPFNDTVPQPVNVNVTEATPAPPAEIPTAQPTVTPAQPPSP